MNHQDTSRIIWPNKQLQPLSVQEEWAESTYHTEVHGSPVSQPLGQVLQGDNLSHLHDLQKSHSAAIQCIYIDPPFGIGTIFRTSEATGGKNTTSSDPIAYRDQWHGGIAGYLSFMHPRLLLLHQLLASDGVIFVHCDWRASAHLRLLLNEVFGSENFRNEILWRRAPNLGRQAASNQAGRTFESILLFSKTPGGPLRGPHPVIETPYPLTKSGNPKGCHYDPEKQSWYTTAPRGDYTDTSIVRLESEGRIHRSPSGKVYIKYFLNRTTKGVWVKRQRIDTLWDDHAVRPLRHRPKMEDMGYDTQKPEGLLERIIGWATRPGDTVLDAFSGSGTTATVAAKLQRRFIAIDAGQAAISITRRRLRALSSISFTVHNEVSLAPSLDMPSTLEMTATMSALPNKEVCIHLVVNDVQVVTEWGIGVTRQTQTWTCLWYSDAFPVDEPHILSVTLPFQDEHSLEHLTIRGITDGMPFTLKPVLLPKVPDTSNENISAH